MGLRASACFRGAAPLLDGYILVVDDDHAMRRVLTDVLSDEGYATRSASDGLEALELCERELPALLITDLNMPRLDGAGLVMELERRGLGKFPVIVVSGRYDLMEEARGIVSFAEAKPVDLERFVRRVRSLLPPIASTPWASRVPVRTGRFEGVCEA